MKKSIKSGLLASALLVTALGACSQGGESPRYATGVETDKRNTVEMVRIPYLLLAESNGSSDISDASQVGLQRFYDEIDIRYGDALVIDRGEGVSEERVEKIAADFR